MFVMGVTGVKVRPGVMAASLAPSSVIQGPDAKMGGSTLDIKLVKQPSN